MTAYDNFAASAPTGIIELRCLELSHVDSGVEFGDPIRLVHDFRDWEVTLETAAVVTFAAGQFRTTPPSIDDDGKIVRALKIDNVDGAIFAALQAVIDSGEPVICTYRVYLSNDLTAPQFDPPERTVIRGISLSGGTLTATAQSADVINRKFPASIYTTDNTPGLKR